MQPSTVSAAADYFASGEHFKGYMRNAADLVSQNAAPEMGLGVSSFSIVPPSEVTEVKQLDIRPAEVCIGVWTSCAFF